MHGTEKRGSGFREVPKGKKSTGGRNGLGTRQALALIRSSLLLRHLVSQDWRRDGDGDGDTSRNSLYAILSVKNDQFSSIGMAGLAIFGLILSVSHINPFALIQHHFSARREREKARKGSYWIFFFFKMTISVPFAAFLI